MNICEKCGQPNHFGACHQSDINYHERQTMTQGMTEQTRLAIKAMKNSGLKLVYMRGVELGYKLCMDGFTLSKVREIANDTYDNG